MFCFQNLDQFQFFHLLFSIFSYAGVYNILLCLEFIFWSQFHGFTVFSGFIVYNIDICIAELFPFSTKYYLLCFNYFSNKADVWPQNLTFLYLCFKYFKDPSYCLIKSSPKMLFDIVFAQKIAAKK